MFDWLPLVRSLVVMVRNSSDTYTQYWRAMTVDTLCRVMLVPLGPGRGVSILTLHLF